jgi:hypothetical protein
MLGLWGGYLLFGLVYTVHIHTHDYYSLQLIPIVALSLGPLGSLVVTQLNQLAIPKYPDQLGLRYYVRVIVLTLFVPALILSAVQYWQTARGVLPGRMAATHQSEVATYQEIGEVVNHSPHTLLLFGDTNDWGYPLLYHGRFSAVPFPRPGDMRGGLSTEEYFNTLYSKYSPEYFIISTKLGYTESGGLLDFWESNEYKDLRNVLIKNFPVMVQNDTYVVFDLRKKY